MLKFLKNEATKLVAISDSPELDVEVLLAHVLGISREQIVLRENLKIGPDTTAGLSKLLEERKKGMPVAYLTGKKEFYGFNFEVNPNVLIPRPETEGLVQLALEKLESFQLSANSLQVLDVGTGSGCVAVSMATCLKSEPLTFPLLHSHKGGGGITITASDISKKALEIAKRNAKKHNAQIEFVQSDLFKNLEGKKFDLIVANLPYVKVADYQSNIFELRAEPKNALTDDTNNWQLITKFIEQLPYHLSDNGIVLMEIDPGAESTIRKTVKIFLPNKSATFHKDLAGRVRYVEITN